VRLVDLELEHDAPRAVLGDDHLKHLFAYALPIASPPLGLGARSDDSRGFGALAITSIADDALVHHGVKAGPGSEQLIDERRISIVSVV
jgi:hypothetical protein